MSASILRPLTGLVAALSLAVHPGPARAQVSPAPAAPAAPAAHVPAVEVLTLANGLKVLLQEDHRAPLVSIRVLYRVGDRDDPPAQPGMAALVADLLGDPSTRHVARGGRDGVIRTVGAHPWSVKAHSHPDYTFVQSVVPSSALALALWLESDRMGFLADGADEPRVAELRAGLAERAAGRTPGERLDQAVIEAVHGAGHPYGPRPEAEAPLAARDVRARIRSHYGPANASLTLIGDLDPGEAKNLVHKLFGPIAGAPAPPQATAPTRPPAGAQRRELAIADLKSMVVLAWPTAAYLEPDDLALDGVARLLRQRLSRRLVDELKVADWASAFQQSRHLGSVFVVLATLAEGRTHDEVERLLAEEIARLQAAEPDPAEVRRARLRVLAESGEERDTLQMRAHWLSLLDHERGDPGTAGNVVASYRGLTGAVLQRAARAQLASERRLTVRCTSGAGGQD